MHIVLEVMLSLMCMAGFYFCCGWLDAIQMQAISYSDVIRLWFTPKVLGLLSLGPLFLWFGVRNLFKYCNGQFWVAVLILVLLINIFTLSGRCMAASTFPQKGEVVGIILVFIGAIVSSTWK
jgi:uncharacterized membrane protein